MDQAREPARAYVELDGVRVWAPDRSDLLREVTWRVRPGEHWALLGPNGAGKTTLLSMAGARRHPSAGAVRVLGQRLGKVDMRELRRLIGVVDQALRMPDELTAEAVVLTGASGSIQPLWDCYGAAERARAGELLELMPSPRLLLLDEPASGLDLAARELLLAALGELAAFEPDLATVVVSHHLEDLPPHTTHALLLAGGAVVAAGQVDAALTGEAVSACFGLSVEVRRHDGRWLATMTGNGAPCLAGPPHHMVG
jgi:iron complex transport system ATP-binding protein